VETPRTAPFFNRQPCSETANTCGYCLSDDFVGTPGNSNDMCVSKRDAYAAIHSVEVMSCKKDSDCLTWYSCALGICTAQAKPCSRDCGFHGECSYIDTVTGYSLETCTQDNILCASICTCYDGYHGTSCNITVAELEVRMSLRLLLVDELTSVMTLQTADSTTVSAWAGSLATITSAPLELPLTTVADSLSLIHAMVTSLLPTPVSSADVISFYEIVNNLVIATGQATFNKTVSEKYSIASELLADCMTTIDLLSLLEVSNMAAGETAATMITASYRITSQAMTLSSDAAITVGQSSYEAVASIPSSSVSVPVNGFLLTRNLSSSTLSIIMVTLQEATFGSLFVSDVPSVTKANVTTAALRLLLDVDELCDNKSDDIDVETEYDIIFSLASTTDLSAVKNRYIITHCYHGQPLTHSISCQIGPNIVVTCSGSASYFVNSSCASTSLTPSCDIQDVNNFPSFNCSVVNYTNTYTTCGCRLCDGYSGSRRRMTTASKGVLQIASSVVVSSADEYAAIIASAKIFSLSAMAHTAKMLTLMAVLWVGLPVCFVLHAYLRGFHGFNGKGTGVGVRRSSLLKRKSVVNSMVAPSEMELKRYLTDYAASCLPDIFHKNKSFARRCIRRIAEEVPLMVIFSNENYHRLSYFQKWLMLFRLLTILSFNMFALSYFFSVSYNANDGSCELLPTEQECKTPRSFVGQTNCEWVPVSTTHGDVAGFECAWRSPQFSLISSLLLTLLVFAVTIPVSYLLDYVFDEILFAPTMEKGNRDHNSEIRQPHTLLSAHTESALVGRARPRNSLMQKLKEHKSLLKKTILPHRVQANRKSLSLALRMSSNESFRVRHVSYAPGHRNQGHGVRYSWLRSAIVHRASGWIKKTSTGEHDSGLTVKDDFITELESDLMKLRSKLADGKDVFLFDQSWGLFNAGIGQTVVLRIGDEKRFQFVDLRNKCVEQGQRVLRVVEGMTDDMCGVKLLAAFFTDLLGLGTSSTKILKDVLNSSVIINKREVWWSMKCLAFSGLVLCNLFFLYSCLLYAANRDIHWQVAWLRAYIVTIVIESLFNPASECFVVCCLVPSTVESKVFNVKSVVDRVITRLCHSHESADDDIENIHSKYFFCSGVVATARPDLLECSFVRGYKTSYPYLFERNDVDADDSSPSRVRSSAHTAVGFTTLVLVLLRMLGALPVKFQRLIIQVVQPVSIALIAIPFTFVQNSVEFIAIATALLVILILYCFRRDVWRLFFPSSSSILVQPSADVIEVSTAVQPQVKREITPNSVRNAVRHSVDQEAKDTVHPDDLGEQLRLQGATRSKESKVCDRVEVAPHEGSISWGASASDGDNIDGQSDADSDVYSEWSLSEPSEIAISLSSVNSSSLSGSNGDGSSERHEVYSFV
jgi:hypothetical protein